MEQNYLKDLIKKIYYKKEYIFLKNKFKEIKYKKILLLGSGPNISVSKDDLKDHILICCNGSAYSLAMINKNINPYLTIIDNELIDKNIAFSKDSRSQIIKNKVLKNLQLGNLISVQSNESKLSDPKILEAKYKSYTYISKNLRKIIVNSVVKTNFLENDNDSLMSTGIFAASLCFFLGASEVKFTGFSLWNKSKDYSYSTEDSLSEEKQIIRNHSLADCLYIGLLKTKKYNISTLDNDFLPLMSNWGGL